MKSHLAASFRRLIIEAEYIFVDGKVRLGGTNATNYEQERKASSGASEAHQVSMELKVFSRKSYLNFFSLYNFPACSHPAAIQLIVTTILVTLRSLTVWVKLQNPLLAVASLSIFCFEVFLSDRTSNFMCDDFP